MQDLSQSRMREKLLLTVNPCAGQKRAGRHLMEVIEILNRAGYEVITHITQDSGDGERKTGKESVEAVCLRHAVQVIRKKIR